MPALLSPIAGHAMSGPLESSQTRAINVEDGYNQDHLMGIGTFFIARSIFASCCLYFRHSAWASSTVGFPGVRPRSSSRSLSFSDSSSCDCSFSTCAVSRSNACVSCARTASVCAHDSSSIPANTWRMTFQQLVHDEKRETREMRCAFTPHHGGHSLSERFEFDSQ